MENLKDQTKEDLTNLINSNGWPVVKKRFEDEKTKLQNIENVDDTLSPELQAIEIKASKKAVKIINDILYSIEAQAKMEARKKIKYL